VSETAEGRALKDLTREWFARASGRKYSYNFTWLGRPIIQFPQDIVALQEIVWSVKPDLIIETGIAHGGSLIFYASMMHLIGGSGEVLGIDVDIREPNRAEIVRHPLFHRIRMIEGSSVDADVVRQVEDFVRARNRRHVMVVLDSLHTHEHVLAELKLYSPFVTKGSYLVALDTIIEDMPPGFSADRPWGPGNSPRTAVEQFLKHNRRFEVDRTIPDKLLITVAPGGYLRCVSD
jgi:cephalosporin hydroxylase